MSGHSDFWILNNFVSIFHLYLGLSRYCVCCLSIATRQSGDDIHDFWCCHLWCWWSLFSKHCVWSWTIFHNVCLRFAGSSRSWMNSGEDSAFPLISSSSSASHEYEGSVSMSPDSSSLSSRSCRGGWAHNLREGCVSPRGNTPHCAWVQWFYSSEVSTTWKLMNRTENR